MKIPDRVYGYPVKVYAELDPPAYPSGYLENGDLEKTNAFLISVSDEGDQNDERFWVSCLGINGKIMSGEMYYTIDAAKEFPKSEFDIEYLLWKKS